MKIVMWVGDQPNQIALANKIHEHFPLTAIIVERKSAKRKRSLRSLLTKGIEKVFLNSIGSSWQHLMGYYTSLYPEFPAVEILTTSFINSNECYDFTVAKQPDLILVSGTRLIKGQLLDIHPSVGILNLHTGLSPYVKGGPNCTNWCLANRDFHLIGNTIMWIDKGIDTGDILTTEVTLLNGEENLYQLHLKVMEHAHELYLKAINYLSTGKLSRVKQSDIATGVTFYSKEWTFKKKWQMLSNFSSLKKAIKNGTVADEQNKLNVISLT